MTAAALPEPPEILYHYTTAEGAYGILTSRTLWCTHLAYTNDSKEVELTLDFLRHYVKQELWRDATGPRKQALERLQTHLQESGSFFHSAEQFALSLSGNGDLLSQWRAYCPSGGYSLGFDTALMRRAAQKHGFLLRRCIYDEKVLFSHVQQVLEAELQKWQGFMPGDSAGFSLGLQVVPPVMKEAALFKHKSFKEEDEWRLISIPTGELFHSRAKVRATRGHLVPYLELPLDEIGDKGIPRFFAGPNRFGAGSAVPPMNILLRNSGFVACEGTSSSTPFRSI